MSELLDPFNFDKNLNEEKKRRISAACNSCEAKQREIKSRGEHERDKLESSIQAKNDISAGSYAMGGGVVGAVVGLFFCIPATYQVGVFGDFLIWVFFIAVGASLFAAFAASMKHTGALHSAVQSSLDSEKARIEQLDKSLEKEIEEIEADCERRKEQHKIEFEKAQRKSSLKFIGSPISKEISEFIAKPFRKSIESSDRRAHIQTIKVPLTFSVYRNKIKTPYGDYDFNIRRVKSLDDTNEAAALANAVATAVHTDIVSSFPVDPSGGEVTPMDIEYEYRRDSVTAKMTYIARNANYVQERSF